jgi:hypothetical protein
LGTLDEYGQKIETTQEQLSYLDANLAKWIDWISVALTVILAWLGISQVGLFILGWSYYNGQNLVGIQPKEIETQAQPG